MAKTCLPGLSGVGDVDFQSVAGRRTDSCTTRNAIQIITVAAINQIISAGGDNDI